MMIPALAAAFGYFMGKSNINLPTVGGALAPKAAPPANAASAWDKVCPVDAHMSADPVGELGGKSFRECTREAWKTGTEEELRDLAQKIRADFPVAAGTLLLRADDHRRRAEAEAKVTPIRAAEPKNGGARVKEEGATS